MPGSSNFLQFNPNKSNILSDADYAASSYRQNGCVSGLAPANVHNKLFYQASIFAAAFNKMLADRGYNVSDADFNALVALYEGSVADKNSSGINLWKVGEAVTVGDIRYSKNAQSYKRFEVVAVTGDAKTGTNEPDFAAANVGVHVTDNHVTWIVDDIRDGTPVGRTVYEHQSTPRAGYVKKNGALLSRSAYPRLWAYAQVSGMLVSEASWSANGQGNFSTGDGATTFRIPDGRAEFIRGADDGRGVDSGRVLGSSQGDALQGHWHRLFTANPGSTGTYYNGLLNGNVTPGTANLSGEVGFTAATIAADGANGTPRLAAETRPRNIALLASIKY